MGAALKTETTEIQWKLMQWARWRHVGAGGCKGYPTQTPFQRLLGGSIPSALISDDEGEDIDRAVARLLERCPDQGVVLTLYYVEGMTIEAVRRHINSARAFGRRVSVHEVRRLLGQAETAIQWILNPEGG